MPNRDAVTNDGVGASSNLLYAAAYAGFVGAGSLALFFLLRDALLGSPLLTPSLLGAALFGPGLEGAGAGVRLDRVALASLVHVTLFTVVGAPFAYLLHRVPALRGAPVVLALGLFGTLGAGVVSLNALVTPGLLEAIGPVSVTLGNAATAVAMTVFYQRAFREEPVGAEARG